ncbi:neuropeptide SIFamide [Tribolium madens]|uniref:neuropeptide SIFamide n=1 Tax=Tribolium madens TaxID=41895 RepID=UPI001CF76478|nr:neuropeptide SIFamide [Tribolium madens]
MQLAFAKVLTVCIVVIILASWIEMTEATYRKPPFNGSIFGKRGATIEYDSASKALSAMCEIASEACQTWFPTQEK